jgi:DNA-binding response OmpR family regulator
MLETEKTTAPPLVLIANDQEWSARSLESILGPQGYAVVRAHTGRQAIDLAWRTHPDAIVIDSGMPDISGVEVCRLLRRDARFTVSTPIIVTTAGPAARADRLEAYRAGAWEYCTDPIDADALLLKLETFIASKRELDQCHDDSLIDRGTGLYNVRGLTRRAQELGADASRCR